MDSFLAFNERFAKIRCDASSIHVFPCRAQQATFNLGQQPSGLARQILAVQVQKTAAGSKRHQQDAQPRHDGRLWGWHAQEAGTQAQQKDRRCHARCIIAFFYPSAVTFADRIDYYPQKLSAKLSCMTCLILQSLPRSAIDMKHGKTSYKRLLRMQHLQLALYLNLNIPRMIACRVKRTSISAGRLCRAIRLR